MKRGGMFSVMLPDEAERLLLRACLQEGESGREAWETWKGRVGDLRAFFMREKQGIRRLMPLLHDNLQRIRANVDQQILGILQSACLREELHSDGYRRVCGQVLSVLTEAGIPFVLLRGPALAETVYGSWILRHCQDVDLLVETEEQPRASLSLQRAGFMPAPGLRSGQSPGTVCLEHNSGLPVQLHTELFAVPFYEPPMPEVWRRTRDCEIAGIVAPILAPEDTLLHVCGHAASSLSRDSLRWVCDAWYVMKAHPMLDWDLFMETVFSSRLALPLRITVGHMAETYGAPVPGDTLRCLDAEARKTDAAGVEAAISCTRLGRRGTYRNILKATRSPMAWIMLVKWVFFPSPGFLRRKYAIRHTWQLPLCYLFRPWRYLALLVSRNQHYN